MPYKVSVTSHIRRVPHRYKPLTHPNYKVPIGQTSTLKQVQINTTGRHSIHPSWQVWYTPYPTTHTLTQNLYATIPTPNLTEGNYTTPVQRL